MRKLGRVTWGVAVAAMLIATSAGPAVAQTTSVTLSAARTLFDFGQGTRLSGEVTPAAPGIAVELVDADTGDLLRTAVTEADGSYETTYGPEHNTRVRARVGTELSRIIELRVRPLLTAALHDVELFDRARVTGRLQPPHPERRVRVFLLNGGSVVDRDWAPLSNQGTFVARFPILGTGRFRAEVRFDDADHAPVRERTAARRVSTPGPLSQGSHGRIVEMLERRLRDLDYHLPNPNRRYDEKTGDAVMAFHKVQGMRRVSNVGPRTWRRLADPRIPHAVSSRPRHHIEIDQSRQVLFVVDRGDITAILHTSTGKPSTPTYNGVFHVHRKLVGYSPNNLYMPSYFDGNRAVHGWPEVPPYPASHGCSRVPMWSARWIYDLMPMGTQVRVHQ